uniref:NADH-ubiquinone oxidoreductase chain 6 n=1 Tax=Peuceptyelus minutus TaxID=2040463 RepID=A0A343KGN5_9HEMI|nr:NADH dehydrogenase subunit 6 [Peuceptyelus minutus]
MIMLITSMVFSSVFLVMKHPLSMGFMLFLQTIITCIMNGMIMKSFWFSYILFITFIGGMLVLFIYVASIASNEKFQFSIKLFLIIMFLIIMMLIFSKLDFQMFNVNNIINENMNYEMNIKLVNKDIMSILKMFNYPFMLMLMLTTMYLLITMISIVKITNIKEGPLRVKN